MLVCFDLGGVLVRICRDWQEGCVAAGIEHRDFRPERGHDDRRDELVRTLQRGELRDADFHRSMSQLLDGVWSPEEVAQVDRAWIVEPYPGTIQIIEGLHEAGLETACLSNTSADHWTTLVGFREIAALRHRHASHLLGLTKPDTAIYAAFEDAVGRPPEDIVFFDDLVANVEAANDRGWDAVQIDHRGDPATQIRRALRNRGLA